MHLSESFYLPALATVKTDIYLSPPLSPLHFTPPVLCFVGRWAKKLFLVCFADGFVLFLFLSPQKKKTDFRSPNLQVLALRGLLPLLPLHGEGIL